VYLREQRTASIERAAFMSVGSAGHSTQLRLVPFSSAGAEAEDARLPDGELDWSRLMARAQDGDRRAYRLLLEDMRPCLRSLALHHFREPGEIEDAVQGMLLAVHALRHTYDRARPYAPWLAAIARRRIVDRIRSQARAERGEVALAAGHATFSPLPANIQHVDAEAARAELRAAIANLPPDQRETIDLLKLGDLSLKEAASASGRSVAALKVATHRAMKRLRKLLQRDAAPTDAP
jgi:RNA polymerase sigma-70 factor (ECF subfamily)